MRFTSVLSSVPFQALFVSPQVYRSNGRLRWHIAAVAVLGPPIPGMSCQRNAMILGCKEEEQGWLLACFSVLFTVSYDSGTYHSIIKS